MRSDQEQGNLFEPTAPFPTQHNSVHEYFEDNEILVFKNRGEDFWWGLMKEGGGFRVLTTEKDAERIIPQTRNARIRPIEQRRTV